MSTREGGPRLGRGLAALMGDRPREEEAAAQGSDVGVRTLPVISIEPGPFQPRTNFTAEAMAELVESVKTHGVLQPLLVRQHPQHRHDSQAVRYQLIAGERRWRAAQQAGLHEVPVLIRHLDDSQARAAALVENLQRQDLDPIEEAEGLRKLQDEHGLTQEKLAAEIGKSRSYIANSTRLLSLPESVRLAVQSGALSAGHARALLGHPDPEAAARLVIARGLSVRQTEALASGRPTPGQSGETQASSSKDPETAALERDLSERLGLKVQISFDGKGGSVAVHYKSLDQLDSLIALLNK